MFFLKEVSANLTVVKKLRHYAAELFPLFFMIDAIILYDQKTIAESVKTSRDFKIEYILYVDLLYPDRLQDAHSSYSLAPTNEVVSKRWLRELQMDMLKNEPFE